MRTKSLRRREVIEESKNSKPLTCCDVGLCGNSSIVRKSPNDDDCDYNDDGDVDTTTAPCSMVMWEGTAAWKCGLCDSVCDTLDIATVCHDLCQRQREEKWNQYDAEEDDVGWAYEKDNRQNAKEEGICELDYMHHHTHDEGMGSEDQGWTRVTTHPRRQTVRHVGWHGWLD